MTVVGRPCPTVEGLTILKGDPVPIGPEGGVVTVIEFWATWCGPCRDAFPHVTQLFQRNQARGLRVIGITSEQDSPQLRSFVQQQGNRMGYTVAVDSDNEAQENLMMPSGARGIPHAFIVDARGVVRHQGHPLEPAFSSVVDQCLKELEAEQRFSVLPNGTEVQLFGLQKAAAHNGTRGKITGHNTSTGRYVVAFAGDGEDSSLSVKAANLLQLVQEPVQVTGKGQCNITGWDASNPDDVQAMVQLPGIEKVSLNDIVLPTGLRVTVHGLVNAAQHNGRTGTIVSFDADAGRYVVQLSSAEQLRVRPGNCHP